MKTTHIFRGMALLVCCVLLASWAGPATAQSYSFGVKDLKMQVYVQPDASVKIVYDITFENYGTAIDIVDIGLPHDNYDIKNMKASIGGAQLSRIQKSTYIDTGVEVHLGSMAIQRGDKGTLHFECTMPDLVYQDTTRKDYASLQITPTWWGSQYVSGSGTIQVAIFMLEGIDPDEMLYQDVAFTEKALYNGRAAAVWQWSNVRATQAYRVGVSFPQRGMTRVIKMTLIELTNKWLADNPGVPIILGIASVVLFAILFFRFSGGTGVTVFVIGLALMICLMVNVPILTLLALPVTVVGIIINEISLKKRRKTYLPPIAQVEGGGIKRGLTAPESAVLLEMPLSKVLMLTVFGMLEKGLIEVVEDSPLRVAITADFRPQNEADRKTAKALHDFRRQVAQNKGTVIHAYEDLFLDQIEANPGKALQNINFSPAVKGLIQGTALKMKGFDLSDTQDYYRRVIERAMEQAQAIGEIEQREQYLDKYLPWVMMNDRYPTVITHHNYHYWPRWSRPLVHHHGGGLGALASSASGSAKPAVGGKTRFSDVAGSFAGWTEATMGGLAGSILPRSLNLPSTKGGFIDLSGSDKVTSDIFEALGKAAAESSRSSGGRSGGGGRSCACACAGCACACACAGGGR
ncbi:MAG: hypothetical protein JXA21_07125 [Anaerolineae bacterium]|nr:hypothetical protein [Anaerolineae bacterium]